jgi:hypothetical protein
VYSQERQRESGKGSREGACIAPCLPVRLFQSDSRVRANTRIHVHCVALLFPVTRVAACWVGLEGPARDVREGGGLCARAQVTKRVSIEERERNSKRGCTDECHRSIFVQTRNFWPSAIPPQAFRYFLASPALGGPSLCIGKFRDSCTARHMPGGAGARGWAAVVAGANSRPRGRGSNLREQSAVKYQVAGL